MGLAFAAGRRNHQIRVATVLCCHMNAVAGAVTDSSYTSKGDATLAVNAAVEASPAKFGGGSLTQPESGDDASWATSSDFTVDTDYTIHFWLYMNESVSANQVLLWVSDIGAQYWRANIGTTYGTGSTHGWYFDGHNGTTGASDTSDEDVIATTTWHHVAMVRVGDVYTLYKNGGVQASFTLTGTIDNTTYGLRLLNVDDRNIDELNVVRKSLWNGPFAPPATAFAI